MRAEGKRVGIWIRVSTEDQAKGESPEHHERRARMYAESKDWNVVKVYRLAGVSGKAVMEHPEAKRMLEDIRSGHIQALIFSKLARLARNTRELLDFADLFREQSADLISLQESIDTSTPAGRLFYTLIAAMATWEREEIAERVAASVPIRAKLGKPLGGAAPFGYRYVDRRLVPDPIEAPIRRRIYELFSEHRRKRTVARLLNESGYRTRNGAKFSYSTVSRLLSDPSAKGRHRANYTKSLGEKRNWKLKPESEWVWSDIEPIVDPQLWDECNAFLKENAAKRKPSRRAKTLFAGYVECQCGKKMYVPSNTPKYVCGTCHNKIPQRDLEDVFREQLKNFLFNPQDFLGRADAIVKEKSELAESLFAEREKITTEMEKVYQLYLAGQLTPIGFGERYRPLEEREAQVREEIPRLQGEIDFLKIEFLSSNQILTEAQNLYSTWTTLPFEEKRRIVENITEKIVLGKEDISFEFCYVPSSAEMLAKEHRNLRDSARRPE